MFKSYGSCLHADFTYSDMEKMLDYANVPVVKPDQEILVCLVDSVEAPGLQARWCSRPALGWTRTVRPP